MKEPNVKDALTALDMVHCQLWSKLEDLKNSESKTAFMNEMELRSLFLLVAASMSDLGDTRIKIKGGG